MKTLLFSVAFATLTAAGAFAQDSAAIVAVTLQPRPDRVTTGEPVAKPSPMNSTSIATPDGYARLVYSQPMLRGREMLGDQNPYGTLWRLGANESTELFTTADMTVADQRLPAGAYSVFCIPTAETWTLIFSSDLGQWGAYTYDEGKDVLRVEVPVTEADEAFEAFTAYFDESALHFAWGTARVDVPVAF